MSLHRVLVERRDWILHDWVHRVREELAPSGVRGPELLDEVPVFLDDLTSELESSDEARPTEAPPPSGASEHGLQRLRLGFDVGGVVREFGMLSDSILAAASAEGEAVPIKELVALASHITAALAAAASEYARQRDSEMQRLATEHLAFLAHELRNPLGAAALSFETLQRRGLIAEGRVTEVVARSLRRMASLIDGALGLARAGVIPIGEMERVDLMKLIGDVVREAKPYAEARGISMRIEARDPVELVADERLVESAVTNLVRNAIKFTREGTLVEIRVVEQAAGVLIEVEDRCGGLPAGATKERFAAFERFGSVMEGFGLGLMIARQAVEAHRGTIRVRDLPGQGCVFTIELPRGG